MSELDYTEKTCSECDVTKHVTDFYTSGPYNGKTYIRKMCKVCSNKKSAERNKLSSSRQDYLRRYYDEHADDIRQKSRQWREDNEEYVKEAGRQYSKMRKEIDPVLAKRRARTYALKRKYGISLEQYEEMLKKQDDRCAICRKHKDDFNVSLAVDHNHVTGEIRGALCTYCNHRVVGRHRDGDLLRRIADYVDQGTGWFVPKKEKKPVRKRNRNV